MKAKSRKRRAAGGNAVIEVSLLLPWFLFLFMGVFDFGFYAYGLITTENAARAATMYLATSYSLAESESVAMAPATQTGACQIVLGEMRRLPNVGATVTSCSDLPVRVTVHSPVAEADGSYSTRVSVAYRTVQLFPLPFMTGRMTMTRDVRMRVYGD